MSLQLALLGPFMAVMNGGPNLRLDPTQLAQQPGLGAFMWWNYYSYHPPALYSHYQPEVAELRGVGGGEGFRAVRLAAMLQPAPGDAPTGATRAAMGTYLEGLYSKQFLVGARNQSRWLSALGVNSRTVLISWAPPASYMTKDPRSKGHILPHERVQDYARFVASSVALLVRSGVSARYVELSNEPDGDWNCRIYPDTYASLVLAARAELDAVGMHAVGIAGPGLYVMSEGGRWWPGLGLSASDYFAALVADKAKAAADGVLMRPSARAIDAVAAYSLHTYDDVLEPDAPDTVAFMDKQMQNLTAVIAQAEAEAAITIGKPLIATEWGVATATLGRKTYSHSVKHDCYSGTDDTMFVDAEALSPAYSARVMAYALLHYNNGFSDAYAWELGDVSGIGKPNVGCFGLYDRVGHIKPSGKALLLLLRRLGASPRMIKRTWQDGSNGIVTAGFVSHSIGASGGRMLTLAVVNTGLENASHGVNVVTTRHPGQIGAGSIKGNKGKADYRMMGGEGATTAVSTSFKLASMDAINCNATAVTKVASRAGMISLELPPSCILVLTAPLAVD